MKLLLDTCAFLWAVLDDPKLPVRVRETIAEMDNEVFVSAVSFWEISIKVGLGKLSLPEAPDLYLPTQRIAAGVELLEIGEAEVCTVYRLPLIHRDPFDRLLIAQADCHGMVIATKDPAIRKYPVRTLW